MRFINGVVVALTVLVLTGCGGSVSPSPTGPSPVVPPPPPVQSGPVFIGSKVFSQLTNAGPATIPLPEVAIGKTLLIKADISNPSGSWVLRGMTVKNRGDGVSVEVQGASAPVNAPGKVEIMVPNSAPDALRAGILAAAGPPDGLTGMYDLFYLPN